MKTISREDLKKRLDTGEDIAVIEALPEKYYAEGHIPGALQLPPDEIEDRAGQLLPDPDQVVVTYCANTECQKSREAAEKLEDLGYKNVYEYAEGKEDWKKAGLPLEKGATGEVSESHQATG